MTFTAIILEIIIKYCAKLCNQFIEYLLIHLYRAWRTRHQICLTTYWAPRPPTTSQSAGAVSSLGRLLNGIPCVCLLITLALPQSSSKTEARHTAYSKWSGHWPPTRLTQCWAYLVAYDKRDVRRAANEILIQYRGSKKIKPVYRGHVVSRTLPGWCTPMQFECCQRTKMHGFNTAAWALLSRLYQQCRWVCRNWRVQGFTSTTLRGR